MSGFLLLLDEESSGGWTPPESGIWPTAFSPTARGGVSATNGIWADNYLRTTKHDSSVNWIGVRTMAGIGAGQKISCTCLIEGSTQETGMGVINSSGTLASYAGSDANGFVLFFHVDEVYHNGGSIATLTGVTIGDRVRMDIDFDAETMQFYKQAGGSGSFVSMGSAIDISALGAGPWYPVSNLYNTNGQQTWDFGQTEFDIEAGFTRGPLGDWGYWNLASDIKDAFLGEDTTRMWEQSTDVGVLSPNVVNGDPVGAWYGIYYNLLRSNATASARGQKQAAGVLMDATGATKSLPVSFARAAADPFWVAYALTDVATSSPSVGAVAAASSSTMRTGAGVGAVSQQARIRNQSVTISAAALGAERRIVVSFDGANYAIVDADGNLYEGAAGADTTATDTISLRLLSAAAGVCNIKFLASGLTGLSADDARNLHYYMGTL